MRLPDLVKQIGKVNGEERVYVEDYVYTYLNELKKGREGLAGRGGFPEKLFPKKKNFEVIPLRVALFGHVYHRERRNFYLVYGAACVVDELEKGKNEEQVRKEFFWEYELIGYVNIYGNTQDFPGKREGYFIFYEKNEAMQNYLIACYGGKRREAGAPAGKRPPFSFAEMVKKLLYGECMVILALAVTTINDYHKMYDFVETAHRAVALTEMENR